MYDDPEGTFGWLVLLMIGVVFVCVNCSGHDGYINANIELNYYENDADIDNQKINYKISKNDDEDVVIHIEESYKNKLNPNVEVSSNPGNEKFRRWDFKEKTTETSDKKNSPSQTMILHNLRKRRES